MNMESYTPFDQADFEAISPTDISDLNWMFQPLQQAQSPYSWDPGQPGMIDGFLSTDQVSSTTVDLFDDYHLSIDAIGLNVDIASGPNGELLQETDSCINTHVCYGAIADVKALIHNTTPTADTRPACYSFSVSKYGNYYGLWSQKSLVAVLDKKTCGAVQGLARDTDYGSVRIEAFVDVAQWSSSISSESQTLTLDLNVYGPRESARRIGRLLSSIGISLQQPVFGLQGFAYYNPHFLHVDQIRGQDVHETPLLNIESVDNDAPLTEHDFARVDTTATEAEEEVDSILDSLAHHEILMERNTDRRMRTKLLHHQKRALDFILRRETGDLPEDLTLWREIEDDDGDIVYQHTITGSRRPQVAEARGGILADEMGLGKSVVSLSVIAASFDRALEFGKQSYSNVSAASNRRRSKATLIIVPSSLLITSWIDEIRKHMHPASLSIWKYHGARRQNEQDQLHANDVVLTTYSTVAMESSGSEGALRNIDWFRIILDEAHDIRNRTTKQFQVVSGLSAQHRWCLTGTPIQNSLEDLGALIAFLRVPVLEDPAIFRKFIVNQSSSQRSDRFQHLRLLLQSICLRRTREVIGLTDTVPELRFINFTQKERDEYQRIIHSCRNNIERVVSRRGKNINSTVLECLLRLRLFCNNGPPETSVSAGSPNNDEILSYLQQVDQAVCAYCAEMVYSIDATSDTDGGTLMSKCYHIACRECLSKYYDDRKRCPKCHESNSDPDITETVRKLRETNGQAGDGLHNAECSSKLTALVEDLESYSQSKSIVFSSWKTTLDLVGRFLAHHGLQYLYIHGCIPLRQRKQILDDFKSPKGPNILLMTLGTGAVGLNLAIASRIYILEPQWNPSIELQAMSRALRLDQKERVTIIRYIVRDSVESCNILSRQNKKLREARGGFEKQTRGVPSDRMQECLNLFFISEEDANQAN